MYFSNEFIEEKNIYRGDSRANMFLYPFKTIAKNNYSLSALTGNECSFPVLDDNSFNSSKICSYRMLKVENWIRKM